MARRADADVYLNPDGTTTEKLYQQPVNVPDGHGGFTPADQSLQPAADGTLEPKVSAVDVSLPSTSGDNKDVVVAAPNGSAQVSIGLDEFNTASGAVDDSTVTYANAATATNLSYDVFSDGVKEDVVLSRWAGISTWSFPVQAQGLTPQQATDGAIRFVDAAGSVQLQIPAPTMWDSRTDGSSGEHPHGPVTQSIAASATPGEWTLTLTADRSWLASSDRVFPVTVDPTLYVGINGQNGSFDTFAMSAYPSTNYNVVNEGGVYVDKVGTYDSSTGTAQTYLGYNLNPILGKHVIAAEWDGYWVSSASTAASYWALRRINTSWDPNNLNWANKPTTGALAAQGNAKGGDTTQADITSTIASVAAGSPWYGLELDAVNTGQEGWKKLAASENGANVASSIAVTYNSAPTVSGPAWPSPATASYNQETFGLAATLNDADADKMMFNVQVSANFDFTALVWQSGWPTNSYTNASGSTVRADVPAGVLTMGPSHTGQQYWWRVEAFDGFDLTDGPTWSFATKDQLPAIASLVAPADKAVQTTLTPTLSATDTDPDNNALQYQFEISTGGGQVSASSGWRTAVASGATDSWTVPAGVLHDGQSYTWRVATRDFPDLSGYYAAPRTVKIDRRLGGQASVPTDSVGPLTVSLASGNVSTSVASPNITTVGGPLGVTLSYNSQATAATGLTGTYYPGYGDNGNIVGTTDSPVLVRTDAAPDFDFGSASPYKPAIPTNAYRIRWSGYLTVPVGGTWHFGAVHDDGLTITVNNTAAFNERGASSVAQMGAANIALTAGTPVPIQLDYAQYAGPGYIHVNAQRPDGTTVKLDPTWLSTAAPAVPTGWGMSADVDGDGGGYVKAAITANSVALYDTTGAAHTYLSASPANPSVASGVTATTASSYIPPAGEYGTLTRTDDGGLTLIDDAGMTWVFDRNGMVTSATSAADDLHPAAVTMQYTQAQSVPRLTSMTDPVSGKSLTLTYGTGSTTTDTDCMSQAGSLGNFDAVPAGMLCKITVTGSGSDSRKEVLRYVTPSGGTTPVLARVETSGDATTPPEVTDFGYGKGLLTGVRDPLANDWISKDPTNRATPGTYALVTYDDYDLGPRARATSVSSAEPNGANLGPAQSQRVVHSYIYQPASTTVTPATVSTDVHVKSLPTPPNFQRRVTMTADTLQMISSTDAVGLTSTFGWDPADKPLWSKDPAGRVTTTVSDAHENPTDVYGPAPASCFDPATPKLPTSTSGVCASMPHTHTGYDETSYGTAANPGTPMTGLAAAWWPSAAMTGTPKRHTTTPINPGTGAVDWAAIPSTANGFTAGNPLAARFTGRLDVPAVDTNGNPTTGTAVNYTLRADVNDGASSAAADNGARVYLDNVPVIDDWQTWNRAVRTTATANGSTSISNPLVGWWRLGESGTTAADSSPTANTGTYASLPANHTGPSAITQDPTNLSTNFTLGYMSAPSKPVYDLPGAMSIEAWIRPTAISGRTAYQEIASKASGNGATNSTFEFRVNPSGQLEFGQANSSGYGFVTSKYAVATDNTFHHVAVTKDNNGLVTLFIDGAIDSRGTLKVNGTTTALGTPATNTSPLYIGGRDDHASYDAQFRGGIDEVELYNGALDPATVSAHVAAGKSNNVSINANTPITAGSHQIRIDYTTPGAVPAKLNLYWTPLTSTPLVQSLIPTAALIPDYGRATSTTTDDSGLPGGVSASFTSYTGNGLDPAYGLATDTITDPTGLALDTKTAYETPGSGYLRPTATALPSGDLNDPAKRTTTTYYGDSEKLPASAVCGLAGVNQAGMAKLVTDPTGATGTPVSTETAYDDAGRPAATHVGTDPWTCITYDGRERVTSKTIPAIGSAPARTITTNYAVGGDPLTTSVTDNAGTITTTTDLLGRTTNYTDVNGVTTTTTYDIAGRATTITSTGTGGGTSTLTTSYDDAGKTTAVTLDGLQLATVGYDTAGETAQISYPAAAAATSTTPATGGNGMTLTGLTKDSAGRDTGSTFKLPDGTTINDAVTRSQAGRITTSNASTGPATANTTYAGWTYAYDNAERLTQAVLAAGTGTNAARPTATFGYGYNPTGGCGADTAAGNDSARTTATVKIGTGPTQTTTSCTDFAARLTSNTVTNPTTATVTAIKPAQAVYDDHGNATRLGNQNWTYDGTDRVITTTATQTAAQTGSTASTQTLTYTRDAADRVIQQVGSGNGPGADSSTQLYGFVDGTDSPEYQLTAGKAIGERYLALPGGVLYTHRYANTGGDTWAIPNLHGDITSTTDTLGRLVASGFIYDPYGQPLDPLSGTVRTGATPATRTGPTTDAWEGGHERAYQHITGLNQTLMGARVYLPSLGIFTSTDPVAGGNSNDYTYPADSINGSDLDGNCGFWGVSWHPCALHDSSGRWINVRAKVVTKLRNKHGLEMSTVQRAMRKASPVRKNGTRWEYEVTVTKHACSLLAGCYHKSIVLLMVVDYRNNGGDGRQQGLITAYCPGYVTKCPSWVNSAH